MLKQVLACMIKSRGNCRGHWVSLCCQVRYLVLTVVAEDRQVDAANEKAGVSHSKWS